jgi:hypothetical protein
MVTVAAGPCKTPVRLSASTSPKEPLHGPPLSYRSVTGRGRRERERGVVASRGREIEATATTGNRERTIRVLYINGGQT